MSVTDLPLAPRGCSLIPKHAVVRPTLRGAFALANIIRQTLGETRMKSVTVAAAIALACVSVLSIPPSAAQSRSKSKLSTSLLALQRSQGKQTAARSARPGAAARRTPVMLRTNGAFVEVSAFGA